MGRPSNSGFSNSGLAFVSAFPEKIKILLLEGISETAVNSEAARPGLTPNRSASLFLYCFQEVCCYSPITRFKVRPAGHG